MELAFGAFMLFCTIAAVLALWEWMLTLPIWLAVALCYLFTFPLIIFAPVGWFGLGILYAVCLLLRGPPYHKRRCDLPQKSGHNEELAYRGWL